MSASAHPFTLRDALVAALAAFLVCSGLSPHDVLTWVLEVSWVAVGIVLWCVWLRRVPCTNLLFALLLAHSVLLIIGGFYTYERVPLGIWMQEWMGRPRNDYDRFCHFVQGFVPALLWREVFLAHRVARVRAWLAPIVIGMCLAFSALFELIEFAAAHLLGDASGAYLGSQGDVWDAQWDMLWCGVGALSALILLARVQDRGLARIAREKHARLTRP